MADNALESFWVRLGFKSDLTGANIFMGGLKQLKSAMMNFAEVALDAAGALGGMIEKTIDEMSEVQVFAQSIDQSAAEIYAMQEAMHAVNVTTEGWRSTLSGLSNMLGQAASGVGKGAAILGKFGIQAKDVSGQTKGVKEVLGDVAEKMEGLSTSEQISMAQRLGIDMHLIDTLKQGRKAFEEFYQAGLDAANLDDQDFEVANALKLSMTEVKEAFGHILEQIAVIIMPIILPIMQAFQWLTEQIIWSVRTLFGPFRAVFGFLSSVITTTGKALKNLGERFTKWANGLIFVRVILYGLRAALVAVTIYLTAFLIAMAVQKVIMFARSLGTLFSSLKAGWSSWVSLLAGGPIVWIIAALIAFGLVLQDLWTYFQGGESVTGDFVAKFPWLKAVLAGIGPLVLAMGRSLLAFWSDYAWPAIQATGAAFVWLWTDVLVPVFNGIIEIAGPVFVLLWELVSSVVGLIADIFLWWWNEVIQPIFQLFSDMWTAIFGEDSEATGEAITFGEVIYDIFWGIGKVIQFVIGLIKWVVDGIRSAVTWLTDLVGLTDSAADGTKNVADNVDKAKGKLRKKYGADTQGGFDMYADGTVSDGPPADRPDVFSRRPQAGAIGPQGGKHVDNSNHVQIGKITVESPDPTKAGANVVETFKKTAKNGQGPVSM